ncbi:hypothetical protein DCO58_00005 [Helicobacter saguini]|uniref:Uncharacterized protein n=2 Tax=Helicobacter saguini TaxID=1548018 RepID=A0A6L7D310_9HELI|nr:contractile injection system protein, VgrG/Pvc8 family [Helicobacter saguini]MWV63219.1 hypothetical protein [Helicobacter saguini]MWV66112.1 hypothetical protein [Helicobacter saguini]MWV68462.1 hypothetical protein [Helicobacter saguini]MWV71984.1 hypothetical protein [Helicobacter saguini]
MNSFITLKIDNLEFIITKASITESLESLLDIKCEGFIESLNDDIAKVLQDSKTSMQTNINLDSKDFTGNNHLEFINNKAIESNLDSINNKTTNSNLDSINSNTIESNLDSINLLLNKQASLLISNPYPSKENIINIESNEYKIYKGIISHIDYLGIKNIDSITSSITNISNKHFFTFNIISCLFRLSLNKANRIYTDKNVLDVIKIILSLNKDKIYKDLDFSNITNTYKPQDIITQYNESDLAFITRLAHNNAIYFYELENVIYFYDSYNNKANIDSNTTHTNIKSILYNTNNNNILNTPCIYYLSKSSTLKQPNFYSTSMNIDYPLDIYYVDSIKTIEYRLIQRLNNTYLAKSNIYNLDLNERINIESKHFIITQITHTLTNEAILNNIDSKDNIDLTNKTNLNSYHNEISLIPNYIPYTPNQKQKPLPPLNTQGIVIGELASKARNVQEENEYIQQEANTIYTDKYNRIKVRLHSFIAQEIMDKKKLDSNNITINNTTTHNTNIESNNNTNIESNTTNNTDISQADSIDSIKSNIESKNIESISYSPFIRVASPIASQNSGFISLPRVSDEVIISYFDNDIDKPYISGSLYNTLNPSLINNNNQTSLSSKTIGNNEAGINELTLTNTKNNEQIYLHAQKDYKEIIESNFNQVIKQDKDSVVKGSYIESITKYHKQEILGLKDVRIGAEYLTNVALSKDTIVGGSNTLNVGIDNKLRVANNSSEYVGGDKNISIQGKLEHNIERYKTEIINDNAIQIIKGYNDIQINKDLHISTQGESIIQSNNNIHISTNQSLSLSANVNQTILADNIEVNAESNIEHKAQNEIVNQVGDTLIMAKSNCVIIKAGGVEVIIDSNGLIVKGGEIKSE